MFVVGFASISLGNYINTVLDSSYLGYGIISLFYLIIFLLLFQLSKSGRLKKIIEKEMRKGLKTKSRLVFFSFFRLEHQTSF